MALRRGPLRRAGRGGSGYGTETYLEGIASQIPDLDLRQWATDRHDPKLAKKITGDAEAAENAGLTGTPSFLLGASGGAMRPFSPSGQASFDEAIEGLLPA